MSSVWLTIPSARPVDQVEPILAQWRAMGYKLALWRDVGGELPKSVDYMILKRYEGYAVACNTLIDRIIIGDPDAEWFVCAGDDTLPDPTKTAEEIAQECRYHFEDMNGGHAKLETFGVMQPTGDRWHEGCGGFKNAPIDRICGSPWLGREFCRRMYGGAGPYFPGYQHMFLDEELQEVAIKLGVLWQRRDLTHRHNHWGRGATDKTIVNDPVIPAHLEKWNTREHWMESKALFTSRKAANFPGHEPIA